MEQQGLSLEPPSQPQFFLNSQDLGFQCLTLDKSSGRFPAKSSLRSQCPSASDHQLCVLAHDVPRSSFHQVMKITGPFIWKGALKKKKSELFAVVISFLTDDNSVRKNRVSFQLSLDA